MERLQGYKFHSIKHLLIPYGYSKTKAGNICVYYKGGFKHYLNNDEKADFKPDGLKEFHNKPKKVEPETQVINPDGSTLV